MAKSTTYPQYIGFYQPHPPVNYTGELVHPVTGEVYKPPSMTKQEFVAECDINNVLKQYKATGIMSHISSKAAQGAYTDLPDPLDYQESLHIVAQAQESFATLPSAVRNRFQNDPEQFLAFLADPKNYDEAKKLGLLKAETPATRVEVTNQSQAPGSNNGVDKKPEASDRSKPGAEGSKGG